MIRNLASTRKWPKMMGDMMKENLEYKKRIPGIESRNLYWMRSNTATKLQYVEITRRKSFLS